MKKKCQKKQQRKTTIFENEKHEKLEKLKESNKRFFFRTKV